MDSVPFKQIFRKLDFVRIQRTSLLYIVSKESNTKEFPVSIPRSLGLKADNKFVFNFLSRKTSQPKKVLER